MVTYINVPNRGHVGIGTKGYLPFRLGGQGAPSGIDGGGGGRIPSGLQTTGMPTNSSFEEWKELGGSCLEGKGQWLVGFGEMLKVNIQLIVSNEQIG